MRTEKSFFPLNEQLYKVIFSEVPNGDQDEELAFMNSRGHATMVFLRGLVDELAAHGHESRILQDGFELVFEHPKDVNMFSLDDPECGVRLILASLQELDIQVELYPRFGLRFMAGGEEEEEEEEEEEQL